MRTFRNWFKCSNTYQEILTKNCDRHETLRAIEANIMTKIKFQQVWIQWSCMGT